MLKSKNKHSFEISTFTGLTYCSYCKRLIWGFSKQGLKCQDCSYTAHYECETRVKSPCISVLKKPVERKSISPKPTKVQHIEDLDDEEHYTDEAGEKGVLFKRLNRDLQSEAEKQYDINKKNKLKAYPEVSFVSAMPKNFSGFIDKSGPLAFGQETVLDILFWENPKMTFVAMIVWTVYCFRPQLLFITPMLIFLGYSLFALSKVETSKGATSGNTMEKKKQSDEKTLQPHNKEKPIPIPIPTSAVATAKATAAKATAAITTAVSATTTAVSATTAAVSATTTESVTVLAPAPRPMPISIPKKVDQNKGGKSMVVATNDTVCVPESKAGSAPHLGFSTWTSIYKVINPNILPVKPSTDLMGNLRFNQNVTGNYLDAYEAIEKLLVSLDWNTDPVMSLKLTSGIFGALVGICVVLFYVPVWILFWVGGLSGFLLNCPLLRALFIVFTPELKFYLRNLRVKIAVVFASKIPTFRPYISMLNNHPAIFSSKFPLLAKIRRSFARKDLKDDENISVLSDVATLATNLNNSISSQTVRRTSSDPSLDILQTSPTSGSTPLFADFGRSSSTKYLSISNKPVVRKSRILLDAVDSTVHPQLSTTSVLTNTFKSSSPFADKHPYSHHNRLYSTSASSSPSPSPSPSLPASPPTPSPDRVPLDSDAYPDFIVENQRYLEGIGWSCKLFPPDPRPFSDISGFKCFKKYIVREDTSASSNINYNTEIYRVSHDFQLCSTDAGGWVYYDDSWKSASSVTTGKSTRQRVWVKN